MCRVSKPLSMREPTGRVPVVSSCRKYAVVRSNQSAVIGNDWLRYSQPKKRLGLFKERFSECRAVPMDSMSRLSAALLKRYSPLLPKLKYRPEYHGGSSSTALFFLLFFCGKTCPCAQLKL